MTPGLPRGTRARFFAGVVLATALAGCSSRSAGTPDSGASNEDGGPDAAASAHDATRLHDAVAKDAADAGMPKDATPTKDGTAPPDGSQPEEASVQDAALDGLGSPEANAGHDATSPNDATDDAASQEAATPEAGAEVGTIDAGVDTGPATLRYIGRTLTDGTQPDSHGACTTGTPCFEWSGTQVLARVTGATEIDLTLSDYGNYFDVLIDGAIVGSPILGDPNTSNYVWATGLDPAQTYDVSLYKRTEASTAGRTIVLGYAFANGEGRLLPPAKPLPHKLEVIGDSISCGYGVLGADATCTGDPSNEDHADSYGALAASAKGAELHTIAASGHGMYENKDGSTTGTLPDLYGLTLPYLGSSTPTWDVSQWIPDAIVIDLGTNDFVNGDPGQLFVDAYAAFLVTLRGYYPNAYILCANGPILTDPDYSTAAGYIQSAIAQSGVTNADYLAFGTQDPANGTGCESHPNVTTDVQMAGTLGLALETKLGW